MIQQPASSDRPEDGIRTLVTPIIQEMGLSLWDLELGRDGRRRVLRLYIDGEEGITLDDCQAVSERVSLLLDAEDPISGAYLLEVASPGLDRRLRGPDDYRRYAGQAVRVLCHANHPGRRKWAGILEGFEQGEILLRSEIDGPVRLRADIVESVRLDPFPAANRSGKRR